MTTVKHGTRSMYTLGCRCDACSAAAREYQRAYRAANAERLREAKNRWRAENPEKDKVARRRYRQNNPWRLHHINATRYFELLGSQDGRCADCKRPASEFKRMLDVDHDHDCCPGTYSCGKCIRGLLCRSCNIKRSYAEGRR